MSSQLGSRRVTLGALAAVVVLALAAVGATIFALHTREDAKLARLDARAAQSLIDAARSQVASARAIARTALARSLAASSTRPADTPRLRALLALQSFRIEPGPRERAAVVGALATVPSSLGVLRVGGGAVSGVAFGQGHQFYTASADEYIRTWDADKRWRSKADELGGDGVFAVAPKALMTTERDKVIYRPRGYGPAPSTGTLNVADVVVAPTARTAATANLDGTITFWRLPGMTKIGHTIKAPGSASGIAFDRTGAILYSVGSEGFVRRWSAASQKEILPARQVKALDVVHDSLSAIAVNPRTGEVAVGGRGRVYRFDAQLRRAAVLHGAQGSAVVLALAFSPDGSHLAVGGATGHVEIWRASDFVPVSPPLPAHTGNVTGVSFSGDGTLLASAGADGVVRLWRVAAPGIETMSSHGRDAIESLALDRAGAKLATGSDDGSLRVSDLGGRGAVTVRPPLTGDPGRSVLSLSLARDGRLLAAGLREYHGEKVAYYHEAWDLGGVPKLLWRHLVSSEDGAGVLTVLSPDGRLLAAETNGKLELLDARTGKARWSFAEGEDIGGIAFSDDGTTLATAHASDGKIRLFRVTDGRLVQTLDESIGEDAGAIAFSHSGDVLAVADLGNSSSKVALWRKGAAGFGPAPARDIHSVQIDALAFSPDDETLAGISYDQPLTLWDVASGNPITTLATGAFSFSLAWAGATLVTGHGDGLVARWDTAALDPTLAHATAALCRFALPALTRREWHQYLPGQKYAPLCR